MSTDSQKVIKDFHCNKETIPGKRCRTILGKSDGVSFYILTPSGSYSPVKLNAVPIECHACKRVTNWKRVNKESRNVNNLISAGSY